MEQMNFTFEKPDLSSLTKEELRELYKKEIGVDPASRGFDMNTQIADLTDPKEGRRRIEEIDRESDQQDILHTYRRA